MSGGVSVVIPTWNRKDLLMRTLETLKNQTHPIRETIVVDNGSTDGAAEAAEAAGARVLRLLRNTGFAHAANQGIAASAGSRIALVNNDVEFEPDWLARLSAALDRPDVWFATGKILRAADPTRLDGAFDAISRGACAWRVGQDCKDSPLFSQPRPIAMASATAVLYRADLFRQVGRFDETFGSYLEDVDLGLRCARRGLQGAYVPEAVARHHGSATLGRWNPESVRLISRNQVLLVAKHYASKTLRANLGPVLVGQGLWGIVAARHGCLAAWIKGKREGLHVARRLPRPEAEIDAFLRSSEREIRDTLRRTGFGPYWKIYFMLTGTETI
jgi:GT2 family glycosyltransferase